MANLEGYGAPRGSTVGVIGDKYTDLNNGKTYKCTGIYTTSTMKPGVSELFYEWSRVITKSSIIEEQTLTEEQKRVARENIGAQEKSFYEEFKEYKWDGSTEGRDSFTDIAGTYYKISNDIPSAEILSASYAYQAKIDCATDCKSTIDGLSHQVINVETTHDVNDLIIDHEDVINESIDIYDKESALLDLCLTEKISIGIESLETSSINVREQQESKIDFSVLREVNIDDKTSNDADIEKSCVDSTYIGTISADNCFIVVNDKSSVPLTIHSLESESIVINSSESANIDDVDTGEVTIETNERKVVLYDS